MFTCEATAQGISPPTSRERIRRLVPGFAGHPGRFTPPHSLFRTEKCHFPRRAGLPEHLCNTRVHIRPDVRRMSQGSGSL